VKQKGGPKGKKVMCDKEVLRTEAAKSVLHNGPVREKMGLAGKGGKGGGGGGTAKGGGVCPAEGEREEKKVTPTSGRVITLQGAWEGSTETQERGGGGQGTRVSVTGAVSKPAGEEER